VNLIAPIYLEIALAVLALVTLVAEAVRPFRRLHRLGCALAVAVLVLLALSLAAPPAGGSYFSGTYRIDAFALFFKRLFLLITALVLAVAAEFSPRLEHGVTEHYVLLLFAAVGMLVLSSAADFILLFVALELVTVSFYVLCSHHRRQIVSLEAGTKYLVMGGIASGLLVYGISYIFGTTGSTGFAEVARAIEASSGPGTALSLGILLVLLGLGFKIAAVPGHMWAPDVYQGSPLPATAFLATGSKIAGFALLLRLLFEGLLPARSVWAPMTVFVAGLTLLYGNLGALGQRDLKRLLGYSSIAHSGYLLMGVVAMDAVGLGGTIFYLAQYAISSMAGFLAMAAVARAGGGSDLSAFAGLHRRSPLLAAGLALSMLSLAGIPPLSGFFGKFLLFMAVLQNHMNGLPLLALAIVAAVGVVISLFYYFGVVRTVYVDAPVDPAPVPVSTPLRVGLIACIAGIVLLGLYQEPLLAASKHAVERMASALTHQR
jgi:NADH-quinone oxidoreductase subunit N